MAGTLRARGAVLDCDAPTGIWTGSIRGYVGSNISDGGADHTALCIYASTGKRHSVL